MTNVLCINQDRAVISKVFFTVQPVNSPYILQSPVNHMAWA